MGQGGETHPKRKSPPRNILQQSRVVVLGVPVCVAALAWTGAGLMKSDDRLMISVVLSDPPFCLSGEVS